MDKGKSTSEELPEFRRVNLKLNAALHKKLRRLCKEESVTIQRKLVSMVRELVIK